ncbi:hypothetical protein DL96DRAFT_1620317 [Flagelloscypha sp. PMI_526]|nr:hypothetical protein DL96DRAFT_1620317 [Flagelloscypha sp. PMI_526]
MFNGLSESVRRTKERKTQAKASHGSPLEFPVDLCFQVFSLCTLYEVVILRRVSKVWFVAASDVQFLKARLIREVRAQCLPLELFGLQNPLSLSELDDLVSVLVTQSRSFTPAKAPRPLSIVPPIVGSQMYQRVKLLKVVLGGRYLVASSSRHVWLFDLPPGLSTSVIPRPVAIIAVPHGAIDELECFLVRSATLLQFNIRMERLCSIYQYDFTSTGRPPTFLEPTFTFPIPPHYENDTSTGTLSWDNQWLMFFFYSQNRQGIVAVHRIAIDPALLLVSSNNFSEVCVMEVSDDVTKAFISKSVVFGFRSRDMLHRPTLQVGLVPLNGPGTPLPSAFPTTLSVSDWYIRIPSIVVSPTTLLVSMGLDSSFTDQMRLRKTSPSQFIVLGLNRSAFRAVHSASEGALVLEIDKMNPGLSNELSFFRASYAPMLGSSLQRLATMEWNGDELVFRLTQSSTGFPAVTQAVSMSGNPTLHTMDPFSGRFAWLDPSCGRIMVFDFLSRVQGK